MSVRKAGVAVWPLYLNGFLGPFGSAMVVPILPEIGESFGTTAQVAALSLSVYMVPFCALLFVSGTLAERWGRRRTLQGALIVYAVMCVACALAPTIPLLLLARAVQGASNAFTTPILVAAISDVTPSHRLGRALGLFGALQAGGQAMGPMMGGYAANYSWRYAFVASGLSAAFLVFFPAPEALPRERVAGPRWRALANRRLGLAATSAFLTHLTGLGMTVLAVAAAAHRFDMSSTARGLVGSCFGLAGLGAGLFLGRLMDSAGARRFGAVSNLVMAVGVVFTAFAPNLPLMVLGVLVTGMAATGARSTVSALAIRSTPSNPGGAASLALAAFFLGGGIAPLIWLPIYDALDAPGFALAGSAAALAAVALAFGPRVGRRVLKTPAPVPVEAYDA